MKSLSTETNQMNMQLLNIGCGSVFHPAWTNIDMASFSPDVQSYDLRKGLPYANNYFDVCYSSHVIEHLTIDEVKFHLKEALRVLKPKGIIRVVVPDLEGIVREYLRLLELVEVGVKEAEADYDWMMLELYDQNVRSFTGGEMGKFLNSPDLKNKEFILSRIGKEAEQFWDEQTAKEKRTIWEKIKSKKISWYMENLQSKLLLILAKSIAGKKGKMALEEGLFRNSGEIHRWMYDRFSLRRLLENAGFVDVRVCRADESGIPNFNSYELDTIAGKIRKPDSLFMEAIKPG
ncbi:MULTISPECIES: methyltransferase domain-containing protein [Oscillatoriales]|nr:MULTISPECIES: methyltransferase domain-containing protein [Oscillatoriales]